MFMISKSPSSLPIDIALLVERMISFANGELNISQQAYLRRWTNRSAYVTLSAAQDENVQPKALHIITPEVTTLLRSTGR